MKINKSRIAQSLLAFALLLTSAAGAQGDLVTVLVNYSSGGQAAATAADFAVNDPGIDLATPVSVISEQPGLFNDISGTGIDAQVASNSGGLSTTTFGNNAGVPIFDSFNFGSQIDIQLTVRDFEEFAIGSNVTAVVYGIGDADNEDGNIFLRYNGIDSEPQFTEADGTGSQVATFNFTLVPNNVAPFITFVNTVIDPDVNRAFNGFSLTGTAAVPEPSSALVITAVGCLVLVRRRRK